MEKAGARSCPGWEATLPSRGGPSTPTLTSRGVVQTAEKNGPILRDKAAFVLGRFLCYPASLSMECSSGAGGLVPTENRFPLQIHKVFRSITCEPVTLRAPVCSLWNTGHKCRIDLRMRVRRLSRHEKPVRW